MLAPPDSVKVIRAHFYSLESDYGSSSIRTFFLPIVPI